MSLEQLVCQNGHEFPILIVNPHDKVYCPVCSIVVSNGLVPPEYEPKERPMPEPPQYDAFVLKPNNTP